MATTSELNGVETVWYSCAETAQRLRAALREAFPGVKFSVRSKTYSGGASISVTYTDGPVQKAVERVTKRFEGADFDGMIDLKTDKRHTVDGQAVQYGADYVFVNREFSNDAKTLIWGRAAYWAQWAADRHSEFAAFHRAASELDFTPCLAGKKPTLRPLGLNDYA